MGVIEWGGDHRLTSDGDGFFQVSQLAGALEPDTQRETEIG
jgi:hypothetical protein